MGIEIRRTYDMSKPEIFINFLTRRAVAFILKLLLLEKITPNLKI
jgi:hypothetical protein